MPEADANSRSKPKMQEAIADAPRQSLLDVIIVFPDL
jgi:hypothetical protein